MFTRSARGPTAVSPFRGIFASPPNFSAAVKNVEQLRERGHFSLSRINDGPPLLKCGLRPLSRTLSHPISGVSNAPVPVDVGDRRIHWLDE